MSGQKFDGGKSPVTQAALSYFPRAILAVGLVSKYGAEKYEVPFSDQNWRKVEDGLNRYEDAIGRHTLKPGIEGPYDEESGLLHAAHRAWNALATLELMLTRGDVLQTPPVKPYVKPAKPAVLPPLPGPVLSAVVDSSPPRVGDEVEVVSPDAGDKRRGYYAGQRFVVEDCVPGEANNRGQFCLWFKGSHGGIYAKDVRIVKRAEF